MIDEGKKRHVYIDAGAHNGQTVRPMLNDPKFTKIYAFEPNPVFKQKLIKLQKIRPFEYIEKAIWTENTTMPFFIGKGDQQGSSLFKEKNNLTTVCLNVQCIDFDEWLQQNFNEDDFIFLKMDIEGSEYPILQKLILSNTIRLISKLVVEFHLHKMSNRKQLTSVHKDIVNFIQKSNCIQEFIGYSM